VREIVPRTCIVKLVATFTANGRRYRAPRRPVLAICADGWDPAYVDDALARRLMPRLAGALADGGTYTLASAQVPTFTNPNNIAIVTGVPAAVNGVAGNHYLDTDGTEVQVTDPRFLRATTIHAAAIQAGIPALCVTAKDKLRRLLATGGVPVTEIQAAMGHADLQTTARYLHARQASEQVDRFARAFAEGED